jgi:hypothetical protein
MTHHGQGSNNFYGATGMMMGATDDNGITRMIGATGMMMGTRAGMSMESIAHNIYNQPTNEIRAGYEKQELYQNSIKKRFYDRLYELSKNQDEFNSKTKHFFNIMNQLELDPNEYLKSGEYYDYLISHFYMNESDDSKGDCEQRENNELWLRYKKNFYQINLTEKSGSIYQSPFDYEHGIIFIGISDTDGICVCAEIDKTISFISPYYFSRASMIHDVKNSVMNTCFTLCINPKTSNIAELVLSGKLSDDQIECLDGVVNVSKSILALHSNYFMCLFTNDTFKKQESYRIEFSKKILEYYIFYCCSSQKTFDPELTIDMITFGDFVQDKKFLQSYYSEIYKNKDSFTNKSLLQIMKFYQDISL